MYIATPRSGYINSEYISRIYFTRENSHYYIQADVQDTSYKLSEAFDTPEQAVDTIERIIRTEHDGDIPIYFFPIK
jgi:hypothetical protein